MESRRLAVAIMAVMMVVRTASGDLIKVAWAPGPTNLTEWATHQPFYVGVWIGFWFESNKQQYNVLRVNKTSYETCNDQGYIDKISKGGGRDVFQLNDTDTYYFLSSGGYCWGGLKIAVNVEHPPPPPAAAPLPGAASGSPESNVVLLSVFFCLFVAVSMFFV